MKITYNTTIYFEDNINHQVKKETLLNLMLDDSYSSNSPRDMQTLRDAYFDEKIDDLCWDWRATFEEMDLHWCSTGRASFLGFTKESAEEQLNDYIEEFDGEELDDHDKYCLSLLEENKKQLAKL